MHPSQSCLHLRYPCQALLLGLTFFVGVAGCGPASSDNTPNVGPRASVDGPPLSMQGPSSGNNPLTPVIQIPVNGTGSASKIEAVSGRDSSHAVSVVSSEAEHPVEGLVVPELMAQKLNSSNVRVRLRALEAWAREAPPGAIDPFILAFEDKDERVRTRAQQLIEQDWARKVQAKMNGERDGR
jgi:hypothetical protein